MSHTWSKAIVLGIIVASAAALGVGCGDSDTTETTGTPGAVCFDYAAFDGTTPAVSFATDVFPILQLSCSLATSCHGSEAGTGGRPYLGTAMKDGFPTAEQLQKIYDQNVGVPAEGESALDIIRAGDPENSFFMYKVDGDFTCGPLTCDVNNRCGQTMPQGSDDVLPQDKRDTLRRWIAQGAKTDT